MKDHQNGRQSKWKTKRRLKEDLCFADFFFIRMKFIRRLWKPIYCKNKLTNTMDNNIQNKILLTNIALGSKSRRTVHFILLHIHSLILLRCLTGFKKGGLIHEAFLDRQIAQEASKLVLLTFDQKFVKFVFGLHNLWSVANLDLFEVVKCPLDPTSKGIFFAVVSCFFDILAK